VVKARSPVRELVQITVHLKLVNSWTGQLADAIVMLLHVF